MQQDRLKVFSGNANPELAQEICSHLGVPQAKASVERFSDGEIYLQILENVRGADVFVVQPTCTPVDQNRSLPRTTSVTPCTASSITTDR